MTITIDLKKLLLTGLLTLLPLFATAGGGDAGGAQGVMDKEGNLYFLDILTEAQLKKLVLVPSSNVNILADIKCSNEQYRTLGKDIQQADNVYPAEGKFETEVAEAKKLLVAAGKVLVPIECPELGKYYWEGVNKMPNLGKSMPLDSFRSTAFPLPQMFDANQVYGEFQIQVAYYAHGEAYFQQQALLRLKTQVRAVFVKETLRAVGATYGLKLRNLDLEKATYFIYHGEIENFSKSVFAEKLRKKFSTCFEIPNSYWFGNTYGSVYYPAGWLNILDRTVQQLLGENAEQGKTWATKTGIKQDVNTCNSQK